VSRTLSVVSRVNLAGFTWTAAGLLTPDTTNGNYAANDGATYLLLVADATPRTCTVTTPTVLGGFAVTDDVISVAASTSGMYGPFPQEVFGPQLLLDFSSTALKFLVLSLLPDVRA
jgi:hypothetical protein